MARSLLDFAKSMERRAAAIGAIPHDASIRKARAVIRYLVHATPVDTSKALSNWQVTLDHPAVLPRQAFFRGEHGSTQAASAETTIAWAEEIFRIKKPGQPIYISNMLPYIARLNAGSGKYMPGGFVEAASLLARVTK